MKWNCDMVMRVRKVLTGAPSLRRAALRKAMKDKHTRRPKVARTGERDGGRRGMKVGRERREGRREGNKDAGVMREVLKIENTHTNVL